MTGRWFPGLRTANPEQVRTFRAACVALWRNPDRTETERYLMLNDRYALAEVPLSPAQRLYHRHGALNDMGREDTTRRRAERLQRRAVRNASRARGGR